MPCRNISLQSQVCLVTYSVATNSADTHSSGRQPTPPEFMLGYQQSKLRYLNQSQVIDVAQRFHDEKVPVSLIVVDFFAWKYQGDWYAHLARPRSDRF